MRNLKKTLSMFLALAMVLTVITFSPNSMAYAVDGDDEDSVGDVSDVGGAGGDDVDAGDDSGDNTSDPVVSEPVTPDVPVVTVSGNELEAVTSSNSAVVVDIAAAPVGVKNQYSVADDTWVDVRANKVTISSEGTTTLSVRAVTTDVEHEQLVSDVATYVITVDTTAPVLSTATISKNTVNKTISLTLSATDSGTGLAKIEYKINNGSWVIYTSPVVFNTVGEYTVVYRAVDNVGNVTAEATQVVTYNTLSLMAIPTVRMLDDSPNNEYIRFRLQDFNIELFDYSYQFVEKGERVDKSDWEYCSGATYMEIDEEGEWDLYIMVEYDDYSDYAKVATCVIDQTEPDIVKVIQPKANSKTNFNITVDARDEFSRTLEYSFDGGKTWGSSDSKTYKKAVTIQPGDIQVRDEAGNVAESGFCGVVEMDGRKTVFTEDPDSVDSNIVEKDEPVEDNNNSTGNTGSNSNNTSTTPSGNLIKTKSNVSVNQQSVNYGYIGGYEDGTFRPDKNISRSELATILTRVFDFQSSGYNNYADVGNHWAASSISAVQSFNMFQTNGNYFMPDAAVTRAEVAHAICQFIDTSNVKIGSNPYNDISGTTYINDILTVSQMGIMNGYGSNQFGPNDVLTRAQVVAIINRIIGANSSGSSRFFSDVPTSHWAYNDIMLASR